MQKYKTTRTPKTSFPDIYVNLELSFPNKYAMKKLLTPLSIHQNACLGWYNKSRPKNVVQFFSTFLIFLQVYAMVNSLNCVSF